MYRIDPARTDLAAEFRARPLGVHSPELQAVLTVMRGAGIEGKHVLVMTRPHAEWTLARMTGDPPRPRLMPEHVFDSIEEAEWLVFRQRWAELTGTELDLP